MSRRHSITGVLAMGVLVLAATVTYDRVEVTPEQIVVAIEKLGYTAERSCEDAREQRPDAEPKAERQAELVGEAQDT